MLLERSFRAFCLVFVELDNNNNSNGKQNNKKCKKTVLLLLLLFSLVETIQLVVVANCALKTMRRYLIKWGEVEI